MVTFCSSRMITLAMLNYLLSVVLFASELTGQLQDFSDHSRRRIPSTTQSVADEGVQKYELPAESMLSRADKVIPFEATELDIFLDILSVLQAQC